MKGGLGSEQRSHYFCKSCLNFVYSQILGADGRINVRTALLEEFESLPPFVEVMTDDKLPWAQVFAVHHYARFPQTGAELLALMDAYRAASTA